MEPAIYYLAWLIGGLVGMAKARLGARDVQWIDLFCHGVLSGAFCFCCVGAIAWRFGDDGNHGVGFLAAGVGFVAIDAALRKKLISFAVAGFTKAVEKNESKDTT